MAGDTDIIAAIYDAIIEPSGWDEVVKRIVEATKSVAGGIVVHAEGSALAATFNADPYYTDAYVRHYSTINPMKAPGEDRRSGRRASRHLYHPERQFQSLGVL